MLKSQEQIFLKVEEIQREQNNVAACGARSRAPHGAHHLHRRMGVGVDDDDDRGVLYASANGRHAEGRV